MNPYSIILYRFNKNKKLGKKMNKQISELTQREITRKEFLTITGFGIMSIMGIGSIIKLLSGKSSIYNHQASAGYGASPYGGAKTQNSEL
jgi:hypothetical protein